MQLSEKHLQYWRENLKLSSVLLLIWFIVTFVVAWFARDLHQIKMIGGWPLSFYMAAQGSLIIYVILIWYYAKRMGELDFEYGVDEE